MTTYTWPSSRHFVPATHELRVIDNTQRTVESSLSGYVQTNAMPGARWGWGMDFTAHTQAQRAELEAYLVRLSGRQHRVQMWDMRNPRPRGTIALAGVTLGASAAQFATTLQLAGCRGENALLGSNFEADTSGDGVADLWQRYSAGSTGTLSQSIVLGIAGGAGSQSVSAGALGAAEVDRNGVVQFSVPMQRFAGGAVSAGAYVLATAGTVVRLFVSWLDASGTEISRIDVQLAATGSLQFLAATGACPSNALTADFYVWQQQGSGGPATLVIDLGYLAAGLTPPTWPRPATLLAGDWLGLTGGQLVRVVADAAANDVGAMTVEVRHMLRRPVSSGTAVTLDKPTALYVRTEAPLALPRMPGNVEPGVSFDLVEVFA